MQTAWVTLDSEVLDQLMQQQLVQRGLIVGA